VRARGALLGSAVPGLNPSCQRTCTFVQYGFELSKASGHFHQLFWTFLARKKSLAEAQRRRGRRGEMRRSRGIEKAAAILLALPIGECEELSHLGSDS
jgi:hypothetical protein